MRKVVKKPDAVSSAKRAVIELKRPPGVTKKCEQFLEVLLKLGKNVHTDITVCSQQEPEPYFNVAWCCLYLHFQVAQNSSVNLLLKL